MYFARPNELIQRSHGLVDRSILTKPVRLIPVDIIGLQPL